MHAYVFNTNLSAYPGGYLPIFNENEFGEKKKPPVNIKEPADFYQIEFSIPGVERENLPVKASGCALSMCVIPSDKNFDKQEKFQLHEFNFDHCFTGKIVLLYNSELLFVSAEYKAGILRIDVPKSAHPLNPADTIIVIY